MGRKRKPTIDPKQIRGCKQLRSLLKVLEPLAQAPVHGNRQFFYHQHAALLLLHFYNPLLDSLRSLQRATELQKVQKTLGVSRVSLGSLSESAGHVFDPTLLEPILKQVAEQARPLEQTQGLAGLSQPIVAADGSFLRCLPSMTFALFRHQSKHRGVKLHVQLNVQSWIPSASLSNANGSERKALLKQLREAVLYVMDRGYVDYPLYQAIHDAGSLFVARLKNQCVCKVVSNRLKSKADIKAGVIADQEVIVGSQATAGELTCFVRKIVIRSEGGKELILLTNSDLPAEQIALIYRLRWQVELFFRWFKCVLGCTHWLSRSENGLTIQVYVALLASMLLSLWTGRKPNKADWQMICLHLQGWASEQELTRHLKRAKTHA